MTVNNAEPEAALDIVSEDAFSEDPSAPLPPPLPPKKKIPGLRKAAIFLAQMSSDEAGQVLARLRASEVEELTTEVMRLRAVDPEDANDVLNEFHTMMQARQFVGQGGVEFAKEILASGLGLDKAEEILNRLNVVYTEMPFSSLRNADIRQVVTFLKDEHPQIIALVLAHMNSAQSAEILQRLVPELQADVAHRIATMDRADATMVRVVEDELARRMGNVLAHADMATVGGVSALVEIINRSDRATERSILDWLESSDPELAERVRSQMFVFEDIVTIDDRTLQIVLRQVDSKELATALKGVKDEVREKVMRNVSDNAGAMLQEELDILGRVPARTVEESQVKVVQIIRRMEEAGEITLSRGGEDAFID